MGARAGVCGLLLLIGSSMGCAFGPDERHLRYPGLIRSDDVAAGHRRFDVVCSPCHGNHELRRGPLLMNQRWTPPRVRQRVREGTALMPAIPRHRLSDDELEMLLAYFVTVGVVEAEPVAPALPTTVRPSVVADEASLADDGGERDDGEDAADALASPFAP